MDEPVSETFLGFQIHLKSQEERIQTTKQVLAYSGSSVLETLKQLGATSIVFLSPTNIGARPFPDACF